MTRLENLLGVQALAVVDRMTAGAPSESAALVTLLAHPGHGVGWLADVLGLTDSGGTRLVESRQSSVGSTLNTAYSPCRATTIACSAQS